ncbi:MAG: PorT family protein [Candidatus Aminicenantes bacterium]|nr:PorT family protein [Candidatus Aminicenantes bacterium]
MKSFPYTKKKKGGKRSPLLLVLWIALFLTAAAAIPSVPQDEKTGQKKTYRQIAREMEEAHKNGDLNRVFRIYEKYCGKGGKTKPGKEKRAFKRVNKEVRAEIYRLMFLSYSTLGRPAQADIFTRKYLAIRHRTGIGKTWKHLAYRAGKRYHVAPRFIVGLHGGANFTLARPQQRYSVREPAFETGASRYEKNYIFDSRYSRGSRVGITLEYALDERFRVCIQPTLCALEFQYKDGEIDTPGYTISTIYLHRHSLGYVEIPLLLKYYLTKSKLKPYLETGGFLHLRTSAYKTIISRTLDPLSDGHVKEEIFADLTVKKHILPMNSGFWIGAGCDYETGIGDISLSLEIAYKHGFRNIIDKEQRWQNNELMLGYYDVFDDIKLRTFDISLKIMLPLSFKAFKK